MANGNFGGGDGTAGNPFLVEDVQDFSNMGNNSGASYKLVADIDFQGGSLTPIQATRTSPFSLSLDGDGFTVRNINNSQIVNNNSLVTFGDNCTFVNLKFTDCTFVSSNDCSVLCGEITNSTYDNIQFSNITLNGSNQTGAIAGYAELCKVSNISINNIDVVGDNISAPLIGYDSQSDIEKCKVNGGSVFDGNVVGGIVGWMNGTLMEDCHGKNLNLTSENLAGGVSGFANEAFPNGERLTIVRKCSIESCEIIAEGDSGGFIGIADMAEIYNSYVQANIFIQYTNGGGFLGHAQNTTVENCYSACVITYGVPDDTSYPIDYGSFIGYHRNDTITINNSYYDETISDIIAGVYGEGRTTEQMRQQATFESWDFENVWNILENVTYPTFDAIAQLDAILLNTLKMESG